MNEVKKNTILERNDALRKHSKVVIDITVNVKGGEYSWNQDENASPGVMSVTVPYDVNNPKALAKALMDAAVAAAKSSVEYALPRVDDVVFNKLEREAQNARDYEERKRVEAAVAEREAERKAEEEGSTS